MALADALKLNPVITKLDLSYNAYGRETHLLVEVRMLSTSSEKSY